MWFAIRYFKINSYANKRPSRHSHVDDNEYSNNVSSRPAKRNRSLLVCFSCLRHHTPLTADLKLGIEVILLTEWGGGGVLIKGVKEDNIERT